MNNDIENLNKSSGEETEKQKLSDQERTLYTKVLGIFSNSTLNSENLGKYKISELSMLEVMKRLHDLGLVETVAKFQERLLPTKNAQVAAEELERLMRITLMIVESSSK